MKPACEPRAAREGTEQSGTNDSTTSTFLCGDPSPPTDFLFCSWTDTPRESCNSTHLHVILTSRQLGPPNLIKLFWTPKQATWAWFGGLSYILLGFSFFPNLGLSLFLNQRKTKAFMYSSMSMI